jgi:lipopolysaccharide heptosyltransferase II
LYGAAWNRRVRRILVLGRSHIGDCLLTTPAIRALRRRFPDAGLHVAIPEENRDLLASNPYLDEILFRPRRDDWPGKTAFALAVRRHEYDLVVSFQEKSFFYGWVAGASGARRRITLEHARTRRFFTDAVPIRAGVHEVEKYLAVARALGCAVDGLSLDLVTPAASRETARKLLAEAGVGGAEGFVGICPGATTANKRWPAERFAAAAAELVAALDRPALILGGPRDVATARVIAAALRGRACSLAGRTTLGETAALLEQCRLLLTNDTGPMHMAAALALPVVAIWGPTSAVKFQPRSPLSAVVSSERPCFRCAAPCIHAVSVEQVVAAALDQAAVAAPVARRETRRPSTAGRSGIRD